MRTDYTKGTLRKPTNTDSMYPDPMGLMEREMEERVYSSITQWAKYATLVIFAVAAAVTWAVWA